MDVDLVFVRVCFSDDDLDGIGLCIFGLVEGVVLIVVVVDYLGFWFGIM